MTDKEIVLLNQAAFRRAFLEEPDASPAASTIIPRLYVVSASRKTYFQEHIARFLFVCLGEGKS